MDARLDIFKIFGTRMGEAHVIRNGGGRLRDAVRSLIASQTLLGTDQVMIVHHTDCGFTYFHDNSEVNAKLAAQMSTSDNDVETGETHVFVNDFMPIHNLQQSVRDDLLEYKRTPQLKQNAIVRGFIYDTRTGRVHEVKVEEKGECFKTTGKAQ